MTATMVKVYRSTDDYQWDARRWAQNGWRVAAMTEHTPRSGCLRFLFLGFFALLWKPKPEITVTYMRA